MVGDVIYFIVFLILLILSALIYLSSVRGQNIVCATGNSFCSLSTFFIREGKSQGSSCGQSWECKGWNPISAVDCCRTCVTKLTFIEPCSVFCLTNNCDPVVNSLSLRSRLSLRNTSLGNNPRLNKLNNGVQPMSRGRINDEIPSETPNISNWISLALMAISIVGLLVSLLLTVNVGRRSGLIIVLVLAFLMFVGLYIFYLYGSY